jgi:hypothetical protein
MDSSSNHDGRHWHDCDRQQQRRWVTVAQLVVGQHTDCNGQWDGSGVMDGTMGSGQLPPMQKRHNGRQCKMDSSGDHDGRQQSDRNGRRQL